MNHSEISDGLELLDLLLKALSAIAYIIFFGFACEAGILTGVAIYKILKIVF